MRVTREAVDRIILGYGGDPSLSVEYRVFLVPHGALKAMSQEFAGAYLSHFDQSIIIEWHGSDIGLATGLAHELFHARSPKSTRIDLDRDSIDFRSGVTYKERGGEGTRRLEILEEAIVSTLTEEFYEAVVKKNKLFEEEVEATDIFKLWAERWLKSRNADSQTITMLLGELRYFRNAISIAKTLESYESENSKFDYLAGVAAGL